MANLTDALTLLFVDHGIRLIQTADGLTKEANDRLRELSDAVVALILATDFSRKTDTSTLAAIRLAVSEAYAEIAGQSEQSIAALAEIESRFVVQSVNRVMEAQRMRLPRVTATPAVGGVALSKWWGAQEKDTIFKIVAAVRAVETAEEAAAALQPVVTTAARHAETLIGTAVHRVSTDARNATLKVNSQVINGLQVHATLDSRTCAQCLAYDGSTYDLDGNPTGSTILPWNGGPEYHWRCRCLVIPVIDAPASRLTAEDWLDSKSPAQQDEILGKGRAALYRKGVLTLTDLVSGTGQQLSLADLSKKYNTNE